MNYTQKIESMIKFVDKMFDYYCNGKNEELSLVDKRKKKIIDMIIEVKLKDITIPDRKLLQLIKEYKISISTGLSYISLAERIICSSKYSNVIDANKAWYRYLIVESAKEAYQIAREKLDAYSMVQAANIIGKHNSTDIEDTTQILYEKIIPFLPEITIDPTTLGIKPIKNVEKIKKQLLEKYTSSINIEYEEIIPNKEENISE